MRDPFLTIAIPTFNRCEYLAEQLDRLISQIGKRNDIEILVCDNASQDRTREIVINRENEIQNLRYFCQERNMGLDKNVYTAYEMSRGLYVWFLTDDDYVTADAISLLENVLKENNPQVLVMGSRQLEDSFVIDPLHENVSFTDWSFPCSANHFMAVIMLARLILKKEEIDLRSIMSLPGTVFPQVTLALEVLKKRFSFMVRNSVIITRNPGFIFNNFFDLYLLGVRRAIRYSSWEEAEGILIPAMEGNLNDFVRLEIEERLGCYHSRKGLPFGSWVEGWKEYGSNWRSRSKLLLILFISIIPPKLFRFSFYIYILFRRKSFRIARRELHEHDRCKNVIRISDV